MAYTIACWNIEKNGISSDIDKQANVSDFIQLCVNNNIDVIFLCEVHSARVNDYLGFLQQVYTGKYTVNHLPGGHSNAYVVMIRTGAHLALSQDNLKGLNRGALILHDERKFMVCLAHFKSGQTGLTKDQLQQAASFLDDAQPASWAILGDMNWDYGNRGALTLPGNSHCHTCWPGQTHAKGGTLDWCITGGLVSAQTEPLVNRLQTAMTDMTGPDHKPIIFTFDFIVTY
jgi:endonuclease/exonuclease/phosphatase family metal-dependent hydrolase